MLVQEVLVKSFNSLVHYIWVGDRQIPETFKNNYRKAQEFNPGYEFKLWTDNEIIPLLGEFRELYSNSSIFHRLQFGRYLVLDYLGGICCDFDIEWKKPFDFIYSIFEDCDLIFTRRNSLYSYSSPEKIYLLDDYVIFAKPGLTKGYIQYCLKRTAPKKDESEPFSPYALTEWCIDNQRVRYFDSSQIYDDKDCSLAYHYNQRTWVEKV